LNKIFFRFVTILNENSSLFIKWPTRAEMHVSMEAFGRNNKIEKVIGAIDGTYISITAPKEQRLVYTNRKFFTSMTLQAICDHKLLFLDCFAGYPSSVHDRRVFRNSDIFQDIEQDVTSFFPSGEKILGDMAYPVKNWLMVPYVNRGQLTQEKQYFNTKLSAARQTVERSFALLFGRFRRLKHVHMHRIEAIPAFIIACCVLHNICLNFEDPFMRIYSREGELFMVSQAEYRATVEMGDIQNDEVLNDEDHDNPPNDIDAERERDRIAMELFMRR
jgi:DDE superfamily endonuclease